MDRAKPGSSEEVMAGMGRDVDVTQGGQPPKLPMEVEPIGQVEHSDGTENSPGQMGGEQSRIRQLLDDLRRNQDETRELRAKMQMLERDRSRMAQMAAGAETLVSAMETGIDALQRSTSLQLGYLITHSTRSIGAVLALPYRLLKLVLEARRSGRTTPGEARQSVSVPLPQEWFPLVLRQQLAKFHAECAPGMIAEAERDTGTVATVLARVTGLPTKLSDLRIAAIMDEFTFNAYRDCCETKAVTPEGWREEIELLRPHLLFIESAWDGKDGLWQRKISNASPELRELIAHCRRSGIPVMFWSKEDPVHFKTFFDTAKLADYVFTTDIDCIKHYKLALGHERVYLLPFATQPRAHDPVERYSRKSGFCFAGSYYVRYPTRQRDFANLIGAVSKLAPVDIYDRNHGKTHPNYAFPEQYRPHILGNLAFDQIDVAYKGYQFGININTVKNSQSMFARRVFDLLASNTVTVSNYSRGLRLAFGDLVIGSDDSEQLLRLLKPLVDDPLRMSKFRLAGLRKVMREHTYQHRLGYVAEKIFGRSPEATGAKITVLAHVADEAALSAALLNFKRQLWPSKRLLVILASGFLPAHPPVTDNIEVILASQHGHRKLRDVVSEGHHVAMFAPGDYYGPNYLVDLALATSYSPVAAVGKHASYRSTSDGVQLENSGRQYRMGGDVPLHRALVWPEAMGDATIAWTQAGQMVPVETLAIDEFNYCADAGALPVDNVHAAVDDLVGLDEGMSVGDILKFAENIHGGALTVDKSGEDGIEGIASERLHEMFGPLANKHLSMMHDADGLTIASSLPVGKHAYCYLAQSLPKALLQATDVVRMQLVCEPSQGLDLVLVFQDGLGGKLGHAILKSATNVTAALPAGTTQIQIGVRVVSTGRFTIKRLAFEHVPLQVDTLLPRSRNLLVAKNYPSYGNLYKHAFVHRRAVEYARRGVGVDVFRLGAAQLCFSEYEGIDVTEGQFDHLRAALVSGGYQNILAHVLTEQAWSVLRDFLGHTRIYVWAHGSEVQSWTRRAFECSSDGERQRAAALSERRLEFWRSILKDPHPNLVMVFVSRHLAETTFEDWGFRLPESQYRIIHNFVDGRLFAYRPKAPELRTRILSIRPYAGRVYANDLTVQAIVELSRRTFFDELQFHLIGDGPLFDETVAPVRNFSNVKIEQRFLSQREIAELHGEYGVFLCPTRMDSQGVSRDEAMASGLVPVTNPVSAVPEFVDQDCALLVEPEDAVALADAIERLYRDPALFQRLSTAAAARVREQSAFEATIARELEMIDRAVEAP